MAIVDQYGQELAAGKPILEEIAVQTVRDRYSSYPSHGLTPERLARILREADQGDVTRQSELFEEMEEKDCHLASVLQTRKFAAAGLDWEILPASKSDEDLRIAEAAREMLEYIEDWDQAILDLLDAIGKGFSASEIMWEISEGQVWVEELRRVEQKRFTFNSPQLLLENPRLLTDAQPVWGEELIANKFVVHRHRARSGAASRGGICRPCAYMYLFKNFDIKDWVVFNDLYAVPMRVGKYQSGAGKEEIEVLKRAVFGLANDAAAVISDRTLIELLETKTTGDAKSFETFASFCDRAMSKVVLGHTGSADSTAGKLGSEDAANEVRQDLLEFDAKILAKTIKLKILAPWVAFNFGPDKGIPKFNYLVKQDEDLVQESATLKNITDAGFKRIPVSHFYKRFNIPEPQKGELTLEDLISKAAPATQISVNKAALTMGEAGAVAAQAQIDAAAQSITPEELQAQAEGVLKPIIELIQTGKSFEDILDRLADAYPDMDSSALQQMLERAIFVSEMWGRLNGGR